MSADEYSNSFVGGYEEEASGQHTQFLDLTNGEGGSRDSSGTASYFAEPTDMIAPSPDDGDESTGSGNNSSSYLRPGQEHTGRWTKEEHESFLAGLQLYGKEWKKVAARVKTRTVVQTRTHAQKYFQKLNKAMKERDGDVTLSQVEMGVSADAKKAAQLRKKQKQTSKHQRQSQPSPASSGAAHVLTSLPSVPSQSSAGAFGSYPSHGFSSGSNNNSTLPPPPPAYPSSTSSWRTGMSIVAPDPNVAMRRGFPEPSPAASGKRKLAELAAAQMLAGVASINNNSGMETPPPPEEVPHGSSKSKIGGGMSLQIVNPEVLGITYEDTKGRGGMPSPTTPWDGQLEQLISEERKKEDETASCDGSTDDMGLPHAICGPGNSYGRSPLHKAICEMDMSAVHQELSDSIGAASLHRKDEMGYYPIHSACALGMSGGGQDAKTIATEITKLLLSAGGDASTVDSSRNTPLHWAARSGDAELARLLLMRNCPPDAQNEEGDTALHWGMRAGRRGMLVVQVLIENGARAAILNNEFKRASDVTMEGFVDDKNYLRLDGKKSKSKRAESKRRKADNLEEKRESRMMLLGLSTQSRTLVLHHPECLEHIPKSESDWEVPDRIRSIMRRITPEGDESSGIFPHEVSVSTEFERAKLGLLSRVHSADYLSFVNDLSKELSRRQTEDGGDETEYGGSAPSVVPFTPMVQKSVMKGLEVKKESHSDTSFSAGSLRAARRAAGAVQHAVDCVLVGRQRNAFCVVRPPGHHAGVKGLLAGGESCGFCIFNNVAAGALHAISDERLMCQRCAIVDIDVHHGNGTEEIVKRCQDPGKLFFFSIHLYDHDRRKNGYSFYPGTGDEDDIAHNIINVPISPLWRDQVQSPSGNNATKPSTHNTRHKAKQKSTEGTDDSSSEAVIPSPIPDPPSGISDMESETASMKGSNHGPQKRPPTPSRPMGRVAYRKAIQNRLLPALRAFNPDLILISAGFDAAKGDVGNARHYLGGKERMGLDLEPEDYAWTTRKILEIADICCQGRVVSVLEGGYGRSPFAPPPVPPSEAKAKLDKAFFSECAIRHLHAMVDPYDLEERFGRQSQML